jgi:type II secretory pathway pseudopilin PulG
MPTAAEHLRRAAAFTIVELLAATALATVLMVGVLIVLSHLSRDQKRVAAREGGGGETAVVELLRRDLMRAEHLSFDAATGTLRLSGYGALDRQTLRPTARAALVSYQIEHGGGDGSGAWLTRRQQYLDEPAAAKQWTECVCADVNRFVVDIVQPESVGSKEAGANAAIGQARSRSATAMSDKGSSAMTTADEAQRRGMPTQVRLSIAWTDTQRKPVEQVIELR